jgi:hypothetical protein
MGMSEKKNGGPAYPTVDANREEDYGTAGMTLRDYFAAKALQSFMEFSLSRPVSDTVRDADSASKHYAQVAYHVADAMLAERAK